MAYLDLFPSLHTMSRGKKGIELNIQTEKQTHFSPSMRSSLAITVTVWLSAMFTSMHGKTVLFGTGAVMPTASNQRDLGDVFWEKSDDFPSIWITLIRLSTKQNIMKDIKQMETSVFFPLSRWICPSFRKNQSQLQPRGDIPPFPIQCKNSFGLVACLCPVSDSMEFWTLKSLRQ